MALGIEWRDLAGEMEHKVRPETRAKYFPDNPLRRFLINRFLYTLSAFLEHQEWKRLLDVGCGEGFVDYYLGLKFPGRELVCLESDEQALEIARTINPSFRCLAGDGRSLPFPDRSFDAVICIEVLEHLHDYHEVLADLYRVCSGICVVSVPYFPFYQGSNFLIGKNWSRLGEHPDHVARFTRKKLARDMSGVFAEVHTGFSFPWIFGAGYSFQ